MGLINSDGAITIDEIAAMQDAAKAAQAASILKEVLTKLRNVNDEASQYQGETIAAIMEKASELMTSTNKLIANLEETESYTKRVVAFYQQIDEACRAAIAAGTLEG